MTGKSTWNCRTSPIQLLHKSKHTEPHTDQHTLSHHTHTQQHTHTHTSTHTRHQLPLGWTLHTLCDFSISFHYTTYLTTWKRQSRTDQWNGELLHSHHFILRLTAVRRMGVRDASDDVIYGHLAVLCCCSYVLHLRLSSSFHRFCRTDRLVLPAQRALWNTTVSHSWRNTLQQKQRLRKHLTTRQR